MLRLNKKNIEQALISISKIDIKNASIKEIEVIISSLIEGYIINPAIIPSGQHIYRGRICDKPKFLKEISYPLPEFVKGYGRANDIGQSMFYGCIGTGIPYFELEAKVGDKIIMSLWRTKCSLILNHVGFTDEATTYLKSSRNLGNLYPFQATMQKLEELNNFIYNFLASNFIRKVQKDESYLYKLTIAITNRLIGDSDSINGIMYPTIAMFGNADNIVLRPSYVDKNLEFISVQFFEVTKIDGIKYTLKKLDSAVSLTRDNEIEWTGKSLSFKTSSEMLFRFENDEWFAKDSKGNVVYPMPNDPIRLTEISETEALFQTSFGETTKVGGELSFQSENGPITVKCSINYDLSKKKKFFSAYIPKNDKPDILTLAVIKNRERIFKFDENVILESIDEKTGKLIATNKDAVFENSAFIFSEIKFDFTELKTFILNEYGVNVEFLTGI